MHQFKPQAGYTRAMVTKRSYNDNLKNIYFLRIKKLQSPKNSFQFILYGKIEKTISSIRERTDSQLLLPADIKHFHRLSGLLLFILIANQITDNILSISLDERLINRRKTD